ncbi:MAG: DnaA/Hda family protein [Planctomycetota bacterium]|nr:DnaA/Hda family protein [Planctomycetota bacterium]MDA1165618.1 DnaA/Hda family protein [Planctomycetota bacterium]
MSRSRKSRAAGSGSVPFLVVDENRLAWTAVESIRPGVDPAVLRPVSALIYGPSGCGKSHLCDLLLASHGDSGAIVSAADFAEQVARNYKAPDTFDPAREFSPLKLLIIADVQHLCRHPSAQRVLATLMDDLRRAETTIVCTSNQPPAELKGLIARLANRFRGGPCVAVRIPGPASRVKLLSHFCSHLQIAIPLPLLRLFANELAVSPRELLGLLLRFEELVKQQKAMPDARLARAFLNQEVAPCSVTVEEISKAVARQFGVHLADMRSPARDHVLAVPRQCAMFLSRELTGDHFSKIGDYFGGRSHSTVLHACNRIRQQLDNDAGLRQQLKRTRQMLRIV